MSVTVKFFRGLEAELPTLEDGQPGWTTDTHKLFVGSEAGNIELSGGGGGSSGIISGNATLGADASVTTKEKVFLNRNSGNSNEAIYVSAAVSGVSFTITSTAGSIDTGLVIGYIIVL
ncbi:MAG: hypothetical protein WC309_02875 [Candidatus Paceibacterota bacterium]|jgi:hypothetical protein